jgi:hypothetical protein
MDYSKWTTNEGVVLDIKDMTKEHILNCVRMIKRSKWLDTMERYDTVPNPRPRFVVNYERYEPYLEVFEGELKRRSGEAL